MNKIKLNAITFLVLAIVFLFPRCKKDGPHRDELKTYFLNTKIEGKEINATSKYNYFAPVQPVRLTCVTRNGFLIQATDSSCSSGGKYCFSLYCEIKADQPGIYHPDDYLFQVVENNDTTFYSYVNQDGAATGTLTMTIDRIQHGTVASPGYFSGSVSGTLKKFTTGPGRDINLDAKFSLALLD